jgi:sec-independent protein translocase protein TatA
VSFHGSPQGISDAGHAPLSACTTHASQNELIACRPETTPIADKRGDRDNQGSSFSGRPVFSCLRSFVMFEGLFQPTHLLVIGIIALFVFGPKKLPELGKGLGDGIRSFRDAMSDAPKDAPNSGSAANESKP